MLDKLLMEHPRDIGESYGEHAGHAIYIGTKLLGAGLACLIHAALPGLFVRTASAAVQDVQDLMTKRTSPARMDEQVTSGQAKSAA